MSKGLHRFVDSHSVLLLQDRRSASEFKIFNKPYTATAAAQGRLSLLGTRARFQRLRTVSIAKMYHKKQLTNPETLDVELSYDQLYRKL